MPKKTRGIVLCAEGAVLLRRVRFFEIDLS